MKTSNPRSFSLAFALALTPFLYPLSSRTAATAPSAVSANLLADTAALAPGKPFTLAVTLSIIPGWHIYWSNPGETGIATSFKWTLPQGHLAQPLSFPIPSTFVQTGNITAFGYSGPTTFLFKITPPDHLPAGTVSFAIAASWLACNLDQCVPGAKTLTLTLPIGTPTVANADLFAAARLALPAATPPPDLFALAAPFHSGDAEHYSVQVGWAKAPSTVQAFPPDIDGLQLTVESAATTPGQPRSGPLMAINRALASSTLINLKSHVLVGQKVTAANIPLLIVYTLPGETARHAFFLDIDPAALGARPVP